MESQCHQLNRYKIKQMNSQKIPQAHVSKIIPPELFFHSNSDEHYYLTSLCQGTHLTEFEVAKQEEDNEAIRKELEEEMYRQYYELGLLDHQQ